MHLAFYDAKITNFVKKRKHLREKLWNMNNSSYFCILKQW